MKKIINALASIRCELQDANLKKTGKNKGLGFSYYELADILPAINKLELKYGVVSTMNYHAETRTYSMSLYDEDGVELEISSCKEAEAKLKGGASPIQEEGSMQTYLRRYLYMMGYAIVENDWIDCVSYEEDELQDAAKRKALYAIAGVKGYNKAQVEVVAKKKHSAEVKFLTDTQYDEMYNGFKNLESKK